MFVFFAVFSLFALLVLGTGVLVMARLNDGGSDVDRWAARFAAGLIAGYLLVLTGLPFIAVLLCLGVATGLSFGLRAWRGLSVPALWNADRWSLALYLLVSFLIAGVPIHDWDAKSSWFFTGRILFDQGRLAVTDFWSRPEYYFVAFEYPKFFSAWVALVTTAIGEWGFWLPKVAVQLLWTLAWLGLRSVRRERWSYFLLTVWLVGSFHKLLWDGYMDSFVAVMAGLFWIRLAQNPTDPLRAVVFLAVLPLLKAEGLVLAGLCGIQWLWFVWRAGGFEFIRRSRRELGAWAVLGLAPTLAWSGWKSAHGIHNWLLRTGRVGELAKERISGGGLGVIAQRLIDDGLVGRGALLLALVGAVVWVARKKRPELTAATLFPIFAGALYLIPLGVAFLITPLDLDYNLSTTQDRVVFPVRMALFAICFLWLENWLMERNERGRA